MRVVYYTSATTGTGNVVIGMSIGLGFRRLDPAVEFEILNPLPAAGALCERVGLRHAELPLEDERELGPDKYRDSALFKALEERKPDILIVNKHWMCVDAMLPALGCKKVFTSINLDHSAYRIPLPDRVLSFEPEAWDERFALEPFGRLPFPMRVVDPVILRNRDEILPRATALERLGVSGDKPVFMLCLRGDAKTVEDAKKTYSYLADEGWDTVATSDFEDGLFPVSDCYAAVDLLACPSGYNSLWESVYFGKDALYSYLPTRFENMEERLKFAETYEFKENGADTIARACMDL